MLPCQQLELAAQRCEAASLDLDQQVAADEIDDETADDLFDAIAGALVPVLELSVQRTLVERPDRRDLSFLGCGDLEDRAHDDAPSAPRRSCLRQVTGQDGPAPAPAGEERPPPSLPGPVRAFRPVARGVAGCGVADEPNGDSGPEARSVERIQLASPRAMGASLRDSLRANVQRHERAGRGRLRDIGPRRGAL